MRLFRSLVVLLFGVLPFGGLAVTTASAQETPAPAEKAAEDPAHAELRAFRQALTEAVLERDVERQIALTTDDVVATWQNNEVFRGHDAMREFMNRTNGAAAQVFQGYTVPPAPDDLTILYQGTVGIAYGKSVPHYKILGMEFDLENRWTATVVKDNGQWKVAAYHVSANVLDNPVLTAAKQSVYWTGAIAAAVGVVAGIVIGLFLARRKKAASPA